MKDPDDWDSKDKTYSWKGTPHPLFSVDSKTGIILASAHVREGRLVKSPANKCKISMFNYLELFQIIVCFEREFNWKCFSVLMHLNVFL